MRLAAATLTSLSVLATGFLASVPAARASGLCTVDGITPNRVSVGLTTVVVTTFQPRVRGCTISSWYIYSHHLDSYSDDPRQAFDPTKLTNGQAGTESITVGASDTNGEQAVRDFPTGFSIVRRATWQSGSVDASPEPAAKGSTLTIKGRLLVANWDTLRYAPLAGRSVDLEFRTPTGSYALVKHVTTSSTGWVSTTALAAKTGSWRLRYAGSSITSSALSSGDAVLVY